MVVFVILRKVSVLDMGGTINGILKPSESEPTQSRVLSFHRISAHTAFSLFSAELNFVVDQVVSYMKEEKERFGVNLVASQLVAMKDSRAITDSDRW